MANKATLTIDDESKLNLVPAIYYITFTSKGAISVAIFRYNR